MPVVSGENTKTATKTTTTTKTKTTWPFALVAVLCVAAIAGVLMGATSPLSAARFANTGHWVYNSVVGAVFHIDGATANIDAQMAVDAEEGSQVLQSDTSGFVVGPNRITEFDKASLTPKPPVAPPTDEFPLGIEVVGGPYAVYRNAGTIVRLGDPAAKISAGGAIGNPVVTDDGTMWLHRTGNGRICRIAKDATDLSGCPVSAPKDHAGALTVVAGKPAFVDMFTGELHTIDGDEFGAGVPLGVRMSPGSRPAARDADGKLAILDPERNSLVIVDTTNPDAEPDRVALPPGEYDGPVATSSVVALVDRKKGTVLTFGTDGARKDEAPIEKKNGTPRLHQGEDQRIYVEDADGTQVLVVADDGEVTDVDVTAKPTTPTPGPTRTSSPGTPPAGGNPNRDGDPDPDGGQPDRGQDDGEQGGTPTGPPVTTQPPPRQPPPEPPPVPPSRPGAPPSVAAQPGARSAVVTWGTAADNRAPITAYEVRWQTGSVRVGPNARRVDVDGLTEGVSYTFTVTATNRVGTGPGASSNAVTPIAPVERAAPPVNLLATYDVDDRPTRNVTLTWEQPDLGGGTLVHYEILATGEATRHVTGTRTVYPQVESTRNITFTVRAVTRAPDGRTLIGESATAVHEDTPSTPAVAISQGGPSDTDDCDPPACRWVNASMTGFAPNTTYDIRLSSDSNANVRTESFTTDDSGDATYNQLNYDQPGQRVWVSVLTPDGPVSSDPIVWE